MTKKIDQEIRLGKLELSIMKVVWRRRHATVHDVMDDISQNRKPAYSTILTMMRKLEAKGYLQHTEDRRTYVYSATISKQKVRQSVLLDMLERVFDGSPTLLLASLVEQNQISQKELTEIRKVITEHQKPA